MERTRDLDDDHVPVLHRDEWIAVVHKPPGLLVHRTALSSEREAFLVQRLRDQLGQKVYPVHRLDRPTSGVMVLALDPATASTLGRAVQERAVSRQYLAIVRGWLAREGTIDHPVADKDEPRHGPREAVSDYRCLAQIELDVHVETYPKTRYSLGLLVPHTGRRHQLRRHMKHVNHPIIGDTSYGRGAHNRFFRAHFGVDRLLLHAWKLGFRHPVTGKSQVYSCAPLHGFDQVIEAFAWDLPATAG